MCDKWIFRIFNWNQSRLPGIQIGEDNFSKHCHQFLDIRNDPYSVSMVIWYMHVPSAECYWCHLHSESGDFFLSSFAFCFCLRFCVSFRQVCKNQKSDKKRQPFCNKNHTTTQKRRKAKWPNWRHKSSWNAVVFQVRNKWISYINKTRTLLFFLFAYLLGHNIRTWIAIQIPLECTMSCNLDCLFRK